MPGVVTVPTRLEPGVPYGCWHGFVKVPDIKAVVSVIASTDPPAVPEDLPLQTIEGFIRQWHQVLPPDGTVKRFAVRCRDKEIVWLVPNSQPCGVREVAQIWASRTHGKVVPLSQAYSVERAMAVVIAYHPHFWEWYRWFIQSIVKNKKTTIILWLHRKFSNEDEENALISVSDAIWATTETLCQMVGANGVLPNPIGDPPTREPDPFTFGSFGFYKHEAASLINELGWRLPSMRFKCFWTLSPYFRDEAPVELLARSIKEAPHNCEHIVGPFTSEQLHDHLSSLAGYIIWNPPWAAAGEASARIALVLRMGRPILANGDSSMVDPYRRHIPAISRFDAEFLTSLLLHPLDPYVPVKVPTLEEEIETFRSLLSQVLD